MVPNSVSSGVVSIYSTNGSSSDSGGAFAALKTDGSVVAFGDSAVGGVAPSTVTSANSGVIMVYSSDIAFAALKTTATTFDLSFSYYRDIDRYNILRKKENRRRVNLTTLNNNVFTLSSVRDIQSFNPRMPTDKPLRIIVPTYVSSPYSITSTVTIPANSTNYIIIACDEGEPVTIAGSTYVNYGTYVYRRETNNTYTKLTTIIINGLDYNVYGGDGINSSGIALYLRLIPTVITNFPTSITKTSVIDASFALVDPSSNSPVAFTYSSSNPSVATYATNVVTILTPGTTTITVSQEENITYASATATMTLTVNPPNYNGLSIPNSNFTGKNLISATFVGTNLTSSIFTNANLTNVNFTNATIRGVTTGGLTGTSTCTLPSSDYYFKASGSVAGLAGNDTYIIGPYVRITGMDLLERGYIQYTHRVIHRSNNRWIIEHRFSSITLRLRFSKWIHRRKRCFACKRRTYRTDLRESLDARCRPIWCDINKYDIYKHGSIRRHDSQYKFIRAKLRHRVLNQPRIIRFDRRKRW